MLRLLAGVLLLSPIIYHIIAVSSTPLVSHVFSLR